MVQKENHRIDLLKGGCRNNILKKMALLSTEKNADGYRYFGRDKEATMESLRQYRQRRLRREWLLVRRLKYLERLECLD